MGQAILIMGSFDTKSEELMFLRRKVAGLGFEPSCLDTSMGSASPVVVEHPSSKVAEAAGATIQEIRNTRDTHWSTEVMIKGAKIIVSDLYSQKKLDGIIAIGGASNTGLSTKVMGTLPFGVSKVMVSSMAAVPAYAGSYFGTSDITMIHSVVDIAGLNPLLENILTRAAAAVCAMAGNTGDTSAKLSKNGSPRVALTEFKFSEKCSRRAAKTLTEAGCEVICFHANGLGDRAMEGLIEQGLIDAVLDLVPAGVAEEILGGNRAAGPERLLAAGAKGIPQVLTPCGFDMLSCGPLERKDRGDFLWTSKNLASRKLFLPDALRVQARTSAEELEEIAVEVASRLKKAKGPWRFLIPERGWSSLSEENTPLFDPDADKAFVDSFVSDPAIGEMVESIDLPLNTEEFGRIAAQTLLRLMGMEDGVGNTAGEEKTSTYPESSGRTVNG